MSAVEAARRTSRFAGIDSLRGFAAAAVFLCHVASYWGFLALPGKMPQVLGWGAQGVDVFIVISGFCLMTPVILAEGRLDVGQFYGRRAWRILPAYWVALAIAAALAVVPMTWHLVVAAPATWWDVAVHAVGMQTWFPPTLGTINGSLWSVSLEIQLYIVFPLLIAAWRRFGIRIVVLAALAVAILWSIGAHIPGTGGYIGDDHALPARLVQFTIGMACAEWLVRRQAPRGWRSALAALVFAATGVAALTLHADQLVVQLAWGLAGAALIMWLTSAAAGGRVMPRAESFGARSYSFYLLHQPLLLVSAPVVAMLPGDWPVQFVVGGLACFAITTAAAALLYRFVELPSHRAGRRRFPHPTPRPRAGA